MPVTAAALCASAVLAAAHLVAPGVARLPARWLEPMGSLSGGAGLAYVVLYLLFELARFGAPKIHAVLPLGPEPLESLFVLLLCALVANYLLQARLQASPRVHGEYAGSAALFLVYNFLAGGGLPDEARGGALNLGFYVLALGLHLLFNDIFLAHLGHAMHRWRVRLALAAMPVLGCLCAAGGMLPEAAQYAMLAMVAGGTIINVIRHELPEASVVRPLPFVAGAATYAALIIATWRF